MEKAKSEPEQVSCLACPEKIEDKTRALEVREKDTHVLVGYLHHTYSCVSKFLRNQPTQEQGNEPGL